MKEAQDHNFDETILMEENVEHKDPTLYYDWISYVEWRIDLLKK